MKSANCLHWLVLVFFYALFVQWSIKANESFKEGKRVKRGKGGIGENTFSFKRFNFLHSSLTHNLQNGVQLFFLHFKHMILFTQ